MHPKNTFNSWRTSILGIVAAGIGIYLLSMQQEVWGGLFLAGALTLFGIKDPGTKTTRKP